MLWGIVKLLQSLVLKKLESFFDTYVFRNLAMSFIVGLVLTVMVQSSSITTSLIVPLAGAGVLRLQQIFPFTVGANIGTTITGLLAALAVAGQPDIEPTLVLAGATVAFAHFLFNSTGAIIFLPFKKMREIPVHVAEWLAEVCLKNRIIPIVFIVLVFYLIPLAFTWNSIAKVFGND
jgi:sodium-dependent phosphate cotransporter